MSDARGAFLTCPACQGPMREREIEVDEERVAIDACESCSGVWFDWWDGESSALALALPPAEPRGPRGRSGGRCPRDGATLFEHPYLDHGPIVERCPSCFGLFAPRAQIEPLKAFHARMPEAGEERHPTTLLSRLWHAFGG
jgi:Zn-finger nucleic acid-binding protein